MDDTVDVRNRRNNKTKEILWFTPPHNMAVVNKIGKEFFRLKKNFPHLNKLYKTFNKNSVKSNYGCMPNVANLINKSNTKN